jgi:hypothetical protein
VGYWIYHDKATLIKPSGALGNAFILNDLADNHFDVAMNYFEPFFQMVEKDKLIASILILDDQNDVKREKLRLPEHAIFHRTESELLEAYISVNNYGDLVRKIKNLNGRTNLCLYETQRGEGFYTECVFEHSFKDGCAEFYSTYSSANSYTKIEVFKKACELEFDERKIKQWGIPSVEQTIKLFKTSLIENYELGRSILTYF